MKSEAKKEARKPRILLTYDNPQPFVMRDLDIFKKHFDAISFEYSGKRSIPRLSASVARTDLNFSWFVLGYATSSVLFSKTFRKKSMVNAGGWDVQNMPEIDYGAMRTDNRIKKTIFALKEADKVLTVSESMKEDVLKWVDRDVEVIHLGFDWHHYAPKGEKERMALTVGNVTKQNLKRKGLETFVRAAKHLPDVPFVLVGSLRDNVMKHLEPIMSSNVKITGYVEDDELLNYFQRSKVYVQISAHEGFGCSMAEAMLCESYPVVTRRGAIPEVVGDAGMYVEYDDPEATAEAIAKALDEGDGVKARGRISTNFPIEKREEKLVRSVLDCLGS
jgi:glycosyltransferase involved in cell wall biosynthesis